MIEFNSETVKGNIPSAIAASTTLHSKPRLGGTLQLDLSDEVVILFGQLSPLLLRNLVRRER